MAKSSFFSASGINATNTNVIQSSVISAANSAEQAALAFDKLDDRYLGNKTSNPTTDNDGDSLVVGTLYYNTVSNEILVYKDVGWQNLTEALPKAGGTLTGALLGTTSSFSGTTSLNNSSINFGFASGTAEIKAKGSSGSPSANIDLFRTNSAGNTLLGLRVSAEGAVTMDGLLEGVKALQMGGALTGATTINASTSVTAPRLTILAADGVSPNDYVASFKNQEATNSQSFGVSIAAGSTGSDIAFNVVDRDASNVLLRVLGNGSTTIGGASIFNGTVLASGALLSGNLELAYAYPRIKLTDTNNNSDFSIINDNGKFGIFDDTNNDYRLIVSATGNVGIGCTASGKLSIEGDTASSEASHITFKNTQGAKVFAVGGGQSGVTNNGFVIRNVTDNTFPLVISDAGASVFASSVTAPTVNVGSGLTIYSDGNTSRIAETGTGDLLIQGTNLTLADTTTGENFLTAISNGAVKLFYNGSPRLETSASGLTVTGDIEINQGPSIKSGTNSPEASVTAPIGSLFLRTNGGAGSTLYVKESGSGNLGWAAV